MRKKILCYSRTKFHDLLFPRFISFLVQQEFMPSISVDCLSSDQGTRTTSANMILAEPPADYIVLPSQTAPRPPSPYSACVVLVVLLCTIGSSFQFGFATGFVNNTVPYVRDFAARHFESGAVAAAVGAVGGGGGVLTGDHDPTTTLVTAFEARFTLLWSLIVSAFGAGMFVGSFAGPVASDAFGRKNAVLSLNAFFLLSAFCIGEPWSYGSLLLGRFLVGVGAGAATACVPIYVAEIAPKEARGGADEQCVGERAPPLSGGAPGR